MHLLDANTIHLLYQCRATCLWHKQRQDNNRVFYAIHLKRKNVLIKMKNITRANYVLFVRFDAIISSIIERNFVYFVRSLLCMFKEIGFFLRLRLNSKEWDVHRNFIDVIIKITREGAAKNHQHSRRSESAKVDSTIDTYNVMHWSVSSC